MKEAAYIISGNLAVIAATIMYKDVLVWGGLLGFGLINLWLLAPQAAKNGR